MTHFAHYRNKLPQLNGVPCLTDAGMETWLLFKEGIDMPLFASFPLINQKEGRAAIDRYMREFCVLARRDNKGFIIDTPTWRASKRWADELGYSEPALRDIHKNSIEYLNQLRAEYDSKSSPIIINGIIGPQDDGYNPEQFLSSAEAEDYHSQQVNWFAEFGADMVSVLTITYSDEAIGAAKAAQKADIPSVISFTVETDGNLPSGQPLGDAIEQVDAATGSAPAYYMINCAHPDHFMPVLEQGGAWRKRIMGLRANASRMSHAELDQAEELDDGNPNELGSQYHDLRQLLPNLMVMGGCCGTDYRHVEAISTSCPYH